MRLSSPERKAQIVAATLDLLDELPLHALTTRRIARRVGVSQPALFRHFQSRAQILLAVVASTRESLASAAASVVADAGSVDERLQGLTRALIAFAGVRPGMQRMLFQDAAAEPEVRKALRTLVDQPRMMVAALVAEGAAAGTLPSVEPARAGRLYLALLQGVLFQWQLDGRARSLEDEGAAMLALWRAGLDGLPRVPVADARGTEALIELDVRPLLAGGTDPLETVLAAIAHLRDDGALVLVAPFLPKPLMRLLESRGLAIHTSSADGVHVVVATRHQALPLLDLRELTAPGPMEQVLQGSTRLDAGQSLVAHTPQVPQMAMPLLRERGLQTQVAPLPDGSAVLHVARI